MNIDQRLSKSELEAARRSANATNIGIAKLVMFVITQLKLPTFSAVEAAANRSDNPKGEPVPDFAPILRNMLTSMDSAAREELLYANARNPLARKLADWWEERVKAEQQRQEALVQAAAQHAAAKAQRAEAKAKCAEWLKLHAIHLEQLPDLLTIPLASEVVILDVEKNQPLSLIGSFAFVTGVNIVDGAIWYDTNLGNFCAGMVQMIKLPTQNRIDAAIRSVQKDEEDDW